MAILYGPGFLGTFWKGGVETCQRPTQQFNALSQTATRFYCFNICGKIQLCITGDFMLHLLKMNWSYIFCRLNWCCLIMWESGSLNQLETGVLPEYVHTPRKIDISHYLYPPLHYPFNSKIIPICTVYGGFCWNVLPNIKDLNIWSRHAH